MPRPRRVASSNGKPASPPRGPRRPRPERNDGAGGLDPNDVVLRVLADLDYDPSKTSVAEVEARIAEIEGEATQVTGPGHEVFISDILRDLIEEEGETPRSPLPGQAAATAFEERSLEVTLIRGSLYLEMTAPLPALCPDRDHLVRRTLQGRALLACITLSRQAAAGTWTGIDDGILALAREIGRDLTGRLPAGCDLERPAFPAVAFTAGKDNPMRKDWEAMKPLIVSRDALVMAARAAWHVGAEILVEIEHPATGEEPPSTGR